MLRAVSAIYFESQALEIFTSSRRDVFKLFRTYTTAASNNKTVLTNDAVRPVRQSAESPPPTVDAPSPATPPPPPRRPWSLVAAALAVTASVGGGIYFYHKLSEEDKKSVLVKESSKAVDEDAVVPVPDSSAFPEHVQYLLVGGGTASFAAMRALRSARPDAQVLIVGSEDVLPYMRPPLSKELWREPDLAQRARDPHSLTFRQWNGKRRSLIYEPEAFYKPVDELGGEEGGTGVARGWRVTKLDVRGHSAQLEAPGQAPVTVRFDKCLVATGSKPVRLPCLSAAARAGRALPLRGARDAARLAARLEAPDTRRVAVLGGGFLAAELSAALADSLRESGKSVVMICREQAPLGGVLPEYLALEAQRRLQEAGAQVLPGEEVVESTVDPVSGRAGLTLRSGARLDVDLVVECLGCEPDVELARDAGLEIHPELGGVLVNTEMQARTDVFAAGDASCFYDVMLGRRRVEHHDHAVVSGRLAGENMAAVAPAKPYEHQSMFWSDLGPDLGYEAIGIIDSRLPTVGIFSADAVADVSSRVAVADVTATSDDTATSNDMATSDAASTSGAALTSNVTSTPVDATKTVKREVEAVDTSNKVESSESPGDALSRRYERGVVFYLRDRRVVGVLLWNLFNRMHVARQVLLQGEFDDLFEVGKLFSLHEDD